MARIYATKRKQPIYKHFVGGGCKFQLFKTYYRTTICFEKIYPIDCQIHSVQINQLP